MTKIRLRRTWLVAALALGGQPAIAHQYPLDDTGQTSCFDDDGLEADDTFAWMATAEYVLHTLQLSYGSLRTCGPPGLMLEPYMGRPSKMGGPGRHG